MWWCSVVDEPCRDLDPEAYFGTGLCSACGLSMQDDHRKIKFL